MYLIAGLGNPEARYAATRHNVGFEAVEFLKKELGSAIPRIRFHAEITRCEYNGETILLVRPLTYMNESGVALREIADFFKIGPEEIVVICDDVNLPFGHLRIRPKGSAGGHNGLKSIIAHLGTEEFARVRIGVGGKPDEWDMKDYVLAQMSPEECRAIAETAGKAAKAALCIVKSGPETAMNRYNTRKQKAEAPKQKPEEHGKAKSSAPAAAAEETEGAVCPGDNKQGETPAAEEKE